MMKRICLLAAAIAAGIVFAAEPKLVLAPPFGDHAVLQRDVEVPVWGKAPAGADVTVAFAGQTLATKAGADGAWRVTLAPMAASAEGRAMTVAYKDASGASESVTVNDVLVGEVWIAAGQSNMECPIWRKDNSRFRDGRGALVASYTQLPDVRYVKTPHGWSVAPKPIAVQPWSRMTREEIEAKPFSAIAFYFARELRLALGVPVGIVETTWGGTSIDGWTPRCGYDHCDPVLTNTAAYKPVEKGEFPLKWEKPSDWTAPISDARQQPTVLWNAMVDAWTPMAMQGVIWYQGCQNGGQGDTYCARMHALYEGWTNAFRHAEMPFLFAQLAPCGDNWTEVVEAQNRFAAEEKNAAVVTTADVGNFDDVHPNEKEPVAQRLAAQALKRVYGFKTGDVDAPTFRAVRFRDGRAHLWFDHAKSWYVYRPDGSTAVPFELAGADGAWHPAEIVNFDAAPDKHAVSSPELVVASKDVPDPVRVRYMVRDRTDGVLYNEKALPLGVVAARGVNIPKDKIYVWGYVLDKTPTACPFVFGQTDVSLETATRFFGASRAMYMNSMFDRGYIEKNFPKWDRQCFENCIDNRLTDPHFELTKGIPEVWCALQHGDRLGSAKRIATLSLRHGNIVGVNLDDFNDGNPSNAMTPAELAELRAAMRAINPALKVSVVTYAGDDKEFDLAPYRESVDLVSRWRWEQDDGYWRNLDAELGKLRAQVGPDAKIVHGLYLHDFGKGMESRDPLPFDFFCRTVRAAAASVRNGTLDGVILPQVGWYAHSTHVRHVQWLKRFLNDGDDGAVDPAASMYPHHPGPSVPALRDDWAGGGVLVRRQADADALAGETLDFAFFGDSITHLWEYSANDKGDEGGREVWAAHWGKLKTANFGVSGDRTEHLLWRIVSGGQADGWKAKTIFVMIGINNHGQVRKGFAKSDTPEATAEGTREIVEQLRARHPESKIVLLGCLPWKYDDGFRWVRDYNAILKTFADEKRVFFRDVGDAFLDAPERQKPGLFRDGLHPNPAGYEVYADRIDDILKELGQ